MMTENSLASPPQLGEHPLRDFVMDSEARKGAAVRSGLQAGLVDAYLATKYHVEIWDGFDLRVGEYSDESQGLFNAHGIETSAFLTAWNPLGEKLGNDENRARNEQLKQDLEALSLHSAKGTGVASDGDWAEESLHVLGITFEQAVSLGHRYQQNAIVWVPGDFIPRLVLLR
nr:DUF3293 domain-containing protein [uncultured Sphingomonas sp.]